MDNPVEREIAWANLGGGIVGLLVGNCAHRATREGERGRDSGRLADTGNKHSRSFRLVASEQVSAPSADLVSFLRRRALLAARRFARSNSVQGPNSLRSRM